MLVTIAKQKFRLDADAVRSAVAGVLPEPIVDHYVVIDGRRYPPTQVLALVTGLDRADFTSHHARRTLRRLGFTTGRRTRAASVALPDRGDWPHGGREAEALLPYRGRWVAKRGLEVLVSADTPQQVMAWLAQHDVKGAVVFGVPESQREAEGAMSLGLDW
ncbi:MAG: hypothetical protein ACRDZ4_17000 [Egibacteraceae bacterium]